MSKNHIQRKHLPIRPTACRQHACVYQKNGVCDNARMNCANSDAACHKWANKRIVDALDIQDANVITALTLAGYQFKKVA